MRIHLLEQRILLILTQKEVLLVQHPSSNVQITGHAIFFLCLESFSGNSEIKRSMHGLKVVSRSFSPSVDHSLTICRRVDLSFEMSLNAMPKGGKY